LTRGYPAIERWWLSREGAPAWVQQCCMAQTLLTLFGTLLHTPKPQIRNLILRLAKVTDSSFHWYAGTGMQIGNRVRTLHCTPSEYSTCHSTLNDMFNWILKETETAARE
jgi:hypothetical protein